MKIANRELGVVLHALLQPQHYTALRNMLRVYRSPVDAFGRYLLGRGEYPADIVLGTPTGSLALTAYSHHDILTVNEIFCRLDYLAAAQDRVIVDFGSNIGISAAYFLASAPRSFLYLFEPLHPTSTACATTSARLRVVTPCMRSRLVRPMERSSSAGRRPDVMVALGSGQATTCL